MKSLFQYGSVAIFVASMFTSCVVAKIEANKSEQFNEKLNSVFIAVEGEPFYEAFVNNLVDEMQKELKAKGVKVEVNRYEALSLENEIDFKAKVDALNPDAVLLIKENVAYVNAINNPTYVFLFSTTFAELNRRYLYDLNLTSRSTNKTIWRAKLNSTFPYGMGETAKEAALKMIKQMEQDGLF